MGALLFAAAAGDSIVAILLESLSASGGMYNPYATLPHGPQPSKLLMSTTARRGRDTVLTPGGRFAQPNSTAAAWADISPDSTLAARSGRSRSRRARI